jgi:hypothetical protein
LFSIRPSPRTKSDVFLFDTLMRSKHQTIMLMLLTPFVQCQKAKVQI